MSEVRLFSASVLAVLPFVHYCILEIGFLVSRVSTAVFV